ncbi:MAG: Nif3-like dinuclear metal center hexameric protein [Actinomycetota bacterium]
MSTEGGGGVPLAVLTKVLDRLYPPSSAADWDAVGLICGEEDQPIRRVLFAIDPVAAVVDEAVGWQADLLITHHPLFLRGVHAVPASNPKGQVLHRLIRAGCALYTAHTNADIASPGVNDALARTLGLAGLKPLVPQPLQALDKIVVFVPESAVNQLVDALSAAGAGAVGDYSRCVWVTSGVGSFISGPNATPAIGALGHMATVPEMRIEMVLPRSRRSGVVAALRANHPYEEPAFDVLELSDLGHGTGLGRIGALPAPMTLADFAALVSEVLPATAHGVRVAGPAQAMVRRVAVMGGAGDGHFTAAAQYDADVYLTADLRHHPVSEARAAAGHGPPYIVDVAHWASEWPWLAGCESRMITELGVAGGTVTTRVSTVRTDPWTMHVPSRGSLL